MNRIFTTPQISQGRIQIIMPAVEIVSQDQNGQPFTTESFLDYIRLSHDRWHELQPTIVSHHDFPMYIADGGWVFRGQWNANDWTLTPSAWRKTPDMMRRFQRSWDDGLHNGLKEDQMSKGNFWLNNDNFEWSDGVFEILAHHQPQPNNEYLKAQRGLFVELVPESPMSSSLPEYYDKYEKWLDLESVVSHLFERLPDSMRKICDGTFRKIVLKRTEADRLLRLLNREGLSRSTLMPTLDNLAEDVLEKWEQFNYEF